MRWYNIVSAVLFILSITSFSLAVPVLAQEKREAGADVVHIPKDVITSLGKRGAEELRGAVMDFFKMWGRPIDSSEAHASSIPPPGPDHGSMSVVQAPGSNPASLKSPTSTESGLNWKYWMNLINPVVPGARPPVLSPKPSIPKASTDSDVNWKHWNNPLNLMDPLVLGARPASSKSLSPKPSNPGVWTPPDPHVGLMAALPSLPPLPQKGLSKIGVPPPPDPNLEPLKEHEDEVIFGPPPSPDPFSNYLSATEGIRPAGLRAVIYAIKGKAKESRSVSGTARDDGNTAQKELQPTERSLDRGLWSRCWHLL